MDLYNKFVDKINETLKLTSRSNYSSSNDENILGNTQSTYYKTNEKRKLRKNIFTPEKIKINNYNKKLNFY